MKKVFFSLMLLIVLIACKKSSENVSLVSPSDNNPFYGKKYELRKDSGGLAGIILHKPGNGQIYEFLNNDSFKLSLPTVSVQPFATGKYTLTPTTIPKKYLFERWYLWAGNMMNQKDTLIADSNKIIITPITVGADMASYEYELIP